MKSTCAAIGRFSVGGGRLPSGIWWAEVYACSTRLLCLVRQLWSTSLSLSWNTTAGGGDTVV